MKEPINQTKTEKRVLDRQDMGPEARKYEQGWSVIKRVEEIYRNQVSTEVSCFLFR